MYDIPALGKFFSTLSVNQDRKGIEFVSTIEARDRSMPIFGTQWHPECNSFSWDDSLGADHSPDAVWAADWVIRPFVSSCRDNPHSFPTQQEEVNSLIDQFPLKFDIKSGSQTWYFPAH